MTSVQTQHFGKIVMTSASSSNNLQQLVMKLYGPLDKKLYPGRLKDLTTGRLALPPETPSLPGKPIEFTLKHRNGKWTASYDKYTGEDMSITMKRCNLTQRALSLKS